MADIEVKVWPDFAAPRMYENADERWVEPRLPDFRKIWHISRRCGYAIGLHGSMRRDVDLIAAPWVETAVAPHDLIDAICEGMNAKQVGTQTQKPLGRLAWTLQIDGWFKVLDISVCPKPVATTHRQRGGFTGGV